VFDAETCGLDPTTISRLRSEFANECSLLHELGAHRNIMHIFARVNGQLSFIAEYCQGGSLAKQLRAEPPTMDLSACVRVAKSVARAMRFLHSLPAPVVHGDLTSNNVLLTADGVAKLCDFGLSRTQHQVSSKTFLALSTVV
jgi:serine/threonine protein kinase